MSSTLTKSQPSRRISVTPLGYRICARCIMDTTDPEIRFDETGICNHCHRYFQRAQTEQFVGQDASRRLANLVQRIQGEGRKRDYDCIIGVSGGVDSTYVAYQVKRLGLRPLAVHLDNGWNSELAVDNIKRTLDKLKIDLLTHVIDWEEFRDVQLSFLKASVPNCEIPTDHAILALLVKTALKFKTRFILTGSNLATEGIMPISWGYYNQDLRHLRAIQRRYGTVSLKTLPQISLAHLAYALLIQRVKYVPILNMLSYDKTSAKSLIQNELGWRDYGGKHYESIYTRFFQGYILPKKFGFDKRRAHLSTMICAGSVTRRDALEELETDAYANCDLQWDRDFVIKKLGLTEPEFERLMSEPPRTHAEYPSNAMFFQKLQGWKQRVKRIATQV